MQNTGGALSLNETAKAQSEVGVGMSPQVKKRRVIIRKKNTVNQVLNQIASAGAHSSLNGQSAMNSNYTNGPADALVSQTISNGRSTQAYTITDSNMSHGNSVGTAGSSNLKLTSISGQHQNLEVPKNSKSPLINQQILQPINEEGTEADDNQTAKRQRARSVLVTKQLKSQQQVGVSPGVPFDVTPTKIGKGSNIQGSQTADKLSEQQQQFKDQANNRGKSAIGPRQQNASYSHKDAKKENDQGYKKHLTNLIHSQYLDPEESFEPIQYHKGTLLGKGAYGRVYQGLDKQTGQLLAIKTIQFSLESESLRQEIKTIRKEIRTLKELDHPNIVKYFYTDISDDGKGVDIILEFVPGGSIRQLLNNYHAFDERLVKIYTRQMLQGLAYLHRKNIIHRDLKCANVLVDNMGVIKLSDFGASKKIIENFNEFGLKEDTELSKSVIGSPYWMAPEVISKIGHGKPADIWSLGCCVIEMLQSEPPWSEYGKDSKTIMNIIKTAGRPPKYPDNISRECREFLDYCFDQDPRKRASADELLHHPFVLMKNPKALQESIEAAKLMQSHISLQSSIYNSNIYHNGLNPAPQFSGGGHPYGLQASVNSGLGSIAMNSQLNMAQFLQNHQQAQIQQIKSINQTPNVPVYRSNTLEPPTPMGIGMHMGSVNSINSIYLGGLEGPSSINMASMVGGSNMLNKSHKTPSGGGPIGGRHISFAERLKQAYDKQRQERQEFVIQNWVKNNQQQMQQSATINNNNSIGNNSSNQSSSNYNNPYQ